MAIHNGNSDFSLAVIREDVLGIRIYFKHVATGVNPVTIRVSTPHTTIDTKTWTSLNEGEVASWYVPVRNLGDFKVHISTNRGYSYDWYIIKLRLNGSEYSDIHWFTQQEIDDLKRAGYFASFTLGLVALEPIKAAIAAKSIVGGIVTSFLIGFMGMELTSNEFTIHEGFSPEPSTGLRFKLYDNGTNYVDCEIQKLERGINGNIIVVHEETLRRYYESFYITKI